MSIACTMHLLVCHSVGTLQRFVVAILGLSWFVVTVALTACSGPPSRPLPVDREVLAAFGGEADTSGRRAVAGPRSLFLYVDSSASMRGFVTHPYTEYLAVVGGLLNRAFLGQYEAETLHFDAGTLGPVRVSRAALNDASLYNGRRTSFRALVEHVTANQQPGRVFAVVTDLVQSEPQRTLDVAVHAFGSLARSGLLVQLLGFRSSFVGPYSVESGAKEGARLNLFLDGTQPENTRPFYVLLIASTIEELDTAYGELIQNVYSAQMLDASRVDIEVKDIKLVAHGNDQESHWNFVQKPVLKSLEGGGTRGWLPLVEVKPGRAQDARLDLSLVLDQRSAEAARRLRSALELDLELAARRQASGTWQILDTEQLEAEMLFDEDPLLWRLTLHLPKPRKAQWDAYRLRVRPGLGNLAGPRWVAEWTCYDDSDPAAGNRTLNLHRVVEALQMSMTEKTVFLDQLVLVGGGGVQ